ncbi:unnamed protein product [Ectocarpus sp. 8 AP-2014]
MLLSSLRCFFVPLRRTTPLAFADLPSSSCFSLTSECASQQISRQQYSNGAFVPRGLWFIFILSALL